MRKVEAMLISTCLIRAAFQILHLVDRIELFGLITRGDLQPNDRDMAFVSLISHKSPVWGELRLTMSSISDAMTQCIGVPVNIVLLTPDE